MTDDLNDEDLPYDAPATIPEVMDDLRGAIVVLAGAMLRSGAITTLALNTEFQNILDKIGGRAHNPDVYRVMNQLAVLDLLDEEPPQAD